MRRNSPGGFTLLEILFAISLTALVLVILLSAMRLGYRAEEKGAERDEVSQRIRVLTDRLSWLVRGAYPYFVMKSEDDKTLYFRGGPKSVGFVTSSVDDWAVGPEDRSGLKWVEIYADTDGLMVREKVFYTEDALDDSGGKLYVLDQTVRKIEFQYLDAGDGEDTPTWTDDWDPGDKEYLPSAVKMNLSFEYKDEEIAVPEIIARIAAVKRVR